MRQYRVHVIIPKNKAHVTAKFTDLDEATLFFQQTAVAFVAHFEEAKSTDWVNDDLVHFNDAEGQRVATLQLEFTHTGASHATLANQEAVHSSVPQSGSLGAVRRHS
jgi:hypothetical protein